MKDLSFQNVVFYHASASGLMDGHADFVSSGAGMRTVIEVVRDELQLDSAQIAVPRLGCDEKCRLDTGGQHNAAHGAYPASDAWANVEELDN